MTYETIRLDIADNIATITLNRPERLNAMPPQMADEISEALDSLGGARALIITGEGRAFCSGEDPVSALLAAALATRGLRTRFSAGASALPGSEVVISDKCWIPR